MFILLYYTILYIFCTTLSHLTIKNNIHEQNILEEFFGNAKIKCLTSLEDGTGDSVHASHDVKPSTQ